ncbi:MAG: hypothetical protein E7277_05895, partial [Lachnospiraceae bacterium]|nr:hypothetical protein [Lachnospiraceae bacterium]
METGVYAQNLREKLGAEYKRICYGVCSESQYRNFEKGTRELDVFVQGRLLERLGCGTKRMYYMLRPSAWECFKERTEIVMCLMRGQYERAQAKLAEFEKRKVAKQSLHAQYICRIKAFLGMSSRHDDAQIAEFLEQALAYTVPNYSTNGYREHRLAVCEIDMLLDWYFYKGDRSAETFLEFAEYCKQAGYDDEQMCQIYPKAVWYGYLTRKKKGALDTWKGLERIKFHDYLEVAIRYLRKQKNGYYMWEVCMANDEVLRCLIEQGVTDEETKVAYEQNRKFVRCLEKMYTFIGNEKETEANYLPYLFQNVESVSSIAQRRMLMKNHDEITLASKCNVDMRTLRTLLHGERRPCRRTMEAIFHELNLPMEYSRESFSVKDVDEKKLVEELDDCELYGHAEDAVSILERLR